MMMPELQDHIKKAIQNILQDQQITDHKIIVTPGSNPGDNYGSIIYRIQINGKRDNMDTSLSLICKVPVTGSKITQSVGFQREVNVYKNILEELKKFQQECNIDFKDGFNSFIKCYAADEVVGKEFLILEDLKPQNFIMLSKDTEIDKAHGELVVKELAKLHAFSFALKVKKPEVFKKISNLPEVLIGLTGEKSFFNICECGLRKALTYCDEKFKNGVQKMIEDLPDVMRSSISGKDSKEYLVINHADCWKNNMMFKYEVNILLKRFCQNFNLIYKFQNGTPAEIRLFDWQITRLTSPAVDLCYFLYGSGVDMLIQDHFDNLVDLYYGQLKKSLKSLGSDINQLYPRKVLDDEIKMYSRFGIIFCAFGMNVLLADVPPDMSDMFLKASEENSKDECLGNLSAGALEKYKRRLHTMLQQADKKGYL